MGNEMVSEKKALSGRDTEEVLSNQHYVLKTPYKHPFPDEMQMAVFATGCYWGTEKAFWRMPNVYSTAVGYAGGFTPNPTYDEACSGKTGHTEAVLVVYDPTTISYSDLLRQFFESHDPSQYMGQGNDKGSQYRSAIYTYTLDQDKLARASKKNYEKLLSKEIHTEIDNMTKAGPFYYAHEAYQQYLSRPNSRPYCSAQPQNVSLDPYANWAPSGLTEDHSPKLSEKYWEEYAPGGGCHVGEIPNEQIPWDKSYATTTTTTTTSTGTTTPNSDETTESKEDFVLVDVVGESVIGNDGNAVDIPALQSSCDYICLYFSAHWCSSCKSFTPLFAEYYNSHHEDKKFDIIFVSLDQSQSDFDKYYGSMPWKAVVYSNRDKQKHISTKYGVESIPCVVIINAKNGEILSKNAKDSISNDTIAKHFPYKS